MSASPITPADLSSALRSIIDNSQRSAPSVVNIGDSQVMIHVSSRPSCGVTVCFDNDGSVAIGSGIAGVGPDSGVDDIARAMYASLQARYSRLRVPAPLV